MTPQTEPKATRLVARTSTEIHNLIQRAAEHSGATLSQFLIESATEKAYRVIEQTETLHLSMAGTDALYAILDKPLKANPKLRQAVKHYRDTVHGYQY